MRVLEGVYEGVYYVFYRESRNPKRCYIGIKYPGIDSTPLVVISGRRSREIYSFITQLLDNIGVKYSVFERKKETYIELPLATGLATSIFFLAVYSSLKPLKYSTALEKMILGKMPLMKYFTTMLDLAIDLSNYFGKKEHYVKQTLNRKAARTVSKMLIQLINGITK